MGCILWSAKRCIDVIEWSIYVQVKHLESDNENISIICNLINLRSGTILDKGLHSYLKLVCIITNFSINNSQLVSNLLKLTLSMNKTLLHGQQKKMRKHKSITTLSSWTICIHMLEFQDRWKKRAESIGAMLHSRKSSQKGRACALVLQRVEQDSYDLLWPWRIRNRFQSRQTSTEMTRHKRVKVGLLKTKHVLIESWIENLWLGQAIMLNREEEAK